MNPTRDLVVVLALLGASAIVPLMGGDYWIGVGISTFMWVALTQSWSLLSGLSGYVSLGHVVFYGLGTYIVVTSWEVVPIAVALALAAGAAAVSGQAAAARTGRNQRQPAGPQRRAARGGNAGVRAPWCG